MTNELVALAQARAKRAARRVAIPAVFALMAGLFVLFAVAGLFAALFFWFEPEHGPIAASLICAAVAIVLTIVSLLPLMFKRRRPAPPPSEGTLPQLVSLVAKTAPNMEPRQLILTAAVLGVALILSARGNKK
jgi:uncharacterized membrane protein YhaH (DUF805 family)